MNAKEFYDYITKQMTAEEALLKLLDGAVGSYEHLKFDEGKGIHPILIASMAALDMGWEMAIPEGDDEDEVQGMIMGTSEYVESMLVDKKDEENGCGCKNGCSSSKCTNR